MAKSLVTPLDLRNFAALLDSNINELTALKSDMDRTLASYDWHDAVAMRFRTKYEETQKPINNLRDVMVDFSHYLTRKAAGLEREYLADNA